MHQKTSIVEINGQKYDMASGKIIGAVKNKVSRLKSKTPFISMDGIVRLPVMAKVRPASRSKHPKRVVHNVHRQTQRSKTLMRRIVSRAQRKVKIQKNPIKKHLVGRNPLREARFKQTSQHPKVKHFGFFSQAYKRRVLSRGKARLIANSSKGSHSLALATPMPSVATSSSHQRLERLLDYALARADAHKKALKKRRRGPAKLLQILPKWLNITILILIVGGAAGFYIWRNVPTASLKLAGSAANVQASMPEYVPEGFSLAGPAKAENGVVSLTYKSIDNSLAALVLKEQASNQDSDSVVANNSSARSQIQSSQVNGVAVNVISDGNSNTAYCSSNGTLYWLSDNGAKIAPGELVKSVGSACSSN